MAETPNPKLRFEGICPDCGQRQIDLPADLPEVGDDFDWHARDYDSLRIFMLEELAARFPERKRWTAADLEVVLVEALATQLDQLTDMADRIFAESYLETARRPESVRRLLKLIGYDAVRLSQLKDESDTASQQLTVEEKLERQWREEPLLMERARIEGPRAVHNQHRMVTVQDYTLRLEEHPIVMRAAARSRWSGSWMTLRVAVVLRWASARLDDPVVFINDEETKQDIINFHRQRGIDVPVWDADLPPTNRMILRALLDAYRMFGQEVILEDAIPVGILMDISVHVSNSYYQSEVRREIERILSTRQGGFFEPGRLRFGEDLYASDLFQALMALDGVEHIELKRFKRLGSQFQDQSINGVIELNGLEIAVCDNSTTHPDRGFYQLNLHGGRKG